MSDVENIKSKIDIVDLISEYVQLKASGINHKGRCPFHNEKTPSFMVNRERQFFKCFGCGKNGDIFTFVQEIEGMEFPEALRYLANKAGVELTNTRSEVNSSQKNRIKDINSAAANFFHKVLIDLPVSKPAREYLEGRGLKQETIEEWQIGFVPDQWALLTQYLLKKGHSIDDLVASGLTIKREGANAGSGRGFYDRFRGRIMFPIWDVHGSVVGFTGRVLVETEKSGGKYVNSPQTDVYDKSRVVFGLNKAKQEIRINDLIVMCEGQMDVIACHQAGMKNVVASSGTALTDHQIKLLSRYSKNMNMAFDADEAGIKAAKRGIDLTVAQGLNVKVIQIPDGVAKDPDECLQKNPDVWFEAVKNAKPVMQWHFDRIFKGKDLSDPRQKQTIANELLAEIRHIPFAVEKDHWMKKLSGNLGVDMAVLREDLSKVSQEVKLKTPVVKSKAEDQSRGEVSTQGGSVGAGEKPKEKLRLDVFVEEFLALLLRFPDLSKAPNFSFPIAKLYQGYHKNLYEMVVSCYNQGNFNIDYLRSVFVGVTPNTIDILIMQGDKEFSAYTENQAKVELQKLAERIKDDWMHTQRGQLQKAIQKAEVEGDREKLTQLMTIYGNLGK